MSCLENIALGVLASLIASIVFWYLTFYYTGVKLQFAEQIEKSKSKGEYRGNYRYRIRIKNVGRRDLIEVSMIVKLIIGQNYTLLGIGNNNILPKIASKKRLKKYSNNKFSHTLTLFPIDATINEFKKDFYPNVIIEKAKNKELSLDDIFDTFGEKLKLEVYIFGNDSLTGVRKIFYNTYSKDNIIYGKYSFEDKSGMEVKLL